MKKKCHTESEMVQSVKELENGVDADTVARDHNISKATLYNWKAKYSGMDVSQVKRLRELEVETAASSRCTQSSPSTCIILPTCMTARVRWA